MQFYRLFDIVWVLLDIPEEDAADEAEQQEDEPDQVEQVVNDGPLLLPPIRNAQEPRVAPVVVAPPRGQFKFTCGSASA